MIGKTKQKMLAELLPDGGICLVLGAREILRNGDVFYPFRQSSDMLLLTEVSSPDMIFLAYKSGGKISLHLYSDPITDHEKLWGTSRLSYSEIAEISGISNIAPLDACRDFLHEISEDIMTVYASKEAFEEYLDAIVSPHTWSSLASFLEPLRIYKTDEEIEHIRQAIAITGVAYQAIKENLSIQTYEYQIEAEIARVFRAYHTTEAYPTIVASGHNATILHYTRHTTPLTPHDLLLVDFGAEYRGYAADITRVFSRELSTRQESVIASVLAVKSFAESQLKPGIKKSDYETLVRDRMNEELEKLGLLKRGSPDEEKLSRRYYPHSTSHFLGLDVHDRGSRDTILSSGMVLTCEPGIYIPEEGIGVRIEDDILITEDGNENLSQSIQLFEK